MYERGGTRRTPDIRRRVQSRASWIYRNDHNDYVDHKEARMIIFSNSASPGHVVLQPAQGAWESCVRAYDYPLKPDGSYSPAWEHPLMCEVEAWRDLS
jgi:hypothetical protein